MTRRDVARPPAWIAAGLLLLPWLAAPPARADATPQSCSDCCKLACIEAEILKAKYQRQEYQKLSKRKDLTEQSYKDAEAKMGDVGERFRVVAAQGLETCNYYIPANQSYAEQRKFIAAGFKVRYDAQGRPLPGDYSLSTDMKSCGSNAAGMELAPAVAPCSGIGEAQVAHEEKHQEDCGNRTPAQRAAMTLAQVAAGEVPGYDVEIAALEKLRVEAAQACTKKSCEGAKAAWDQSAERLGFLVDEILVAAGVKPPAKSPLSGAKGGK